MGGGALTANRVLPSRRLIPFAYKGISRIDQHNRTAHSKSCHYQKRKLQRYITLESTIIRVPKNLGQKEKQQLGFLLVYGVQ